MAEEHAEGKHADDERDEDVEMRPVWPRRAAATEDRDIEAARKMKEHFAQNKGASRKMPFMFRIGGAESAHEQAGNRKTMFAAKGAQRWERKKKMESLSSDDRRTSTQRARNVQQKMTAGQLLRKQSNPSRLAPQTKQLWFVDTAGRKIKQQKVATARLTQEEAAALHEAKVWLYPKKELDRYVSALSLDERYSPHDLTTKRQPVPNRVADFKDIFYSRARADPARDRVRRPHVFSSDAGHDDGSDDEKDPAGRRKRGRVTYYVRIADVMDAEGGGVVKGTSRDGTAYTYTLPRPPPQSWKDSRDLATRLKYRIFYGHKAAVRRGRRASHVAMRKKIVEVRAAREGLDESWGNVASFRAKPRDGDGRLVRCNDASPGCKRLKVWRGPKDPNKQMCNPTNAAEYKDPKLCRPLPRSLDALTRTALDDLKVVAEAPDVADERLKQDATEARKSTVAYINRLHGREGTKNLPDFSAHVPLLPRKSDPKYLQRVLEDLQAAGGQPTTIAGVMDVLHRAHDARTYATRPDITGSRGGSLHTLYPDASDTRPPIEQDLRRRPNVSAQFAQWYLKEFKSDLDEMKNEDGTRLNGPQRIAVANKRRNEALDFLVDKFGGIMEDNVGRMRAIVDATRELSAQQKQILHKVIDLRVESWDKKTETAAVQEVRALESKEARDGHLRREDTEKLKDLRDDAEYKTAQRKFAAIRAKEQQKREAYAAEQRDKRLAFRRGPRAPAARKRKRPRQPVVDDEDEEEEEDEDDVDVEMGI